MLDFSSLSPSCFSSFSLWFFGLLSPLLKPKTHFLKPKILCGGGSGEGRRGRGLSSIVVAWVSLFVSLFIFLSLSLISHPFLSLSPLFSFFLSIFPWINPPWWRWGVGFMDRWLGFIIPDVGFIFGGMCFMDQGMSFIFGGVGGWISLFLSLVVVVFVGRWWVIWWWCG